MTAIARHKAEINRSRRRISSLIGKLGTTYVSNTRKAVQKRLEQEAIKLARKREREAKKQAEVARVQEQRN